MLFEPVVGGVDARVPLPPGRAAQLLGRAAVAGQLAAVDGVSGTRQPLRDEPQLDRRTAETVNEQNSDPAAWKRTGCGRGFVFGVAQVIASWVIALRTSFCLSDPLGQDGVPPDALSG